MHVTLFPAVVQEEELVVGINSGGADAGQDAQE